MNDEQRTQYIRRLQQGMRAMTPEEIAAKQAREYLWLANAPRSNGDAARNLWPEIGGKNVAASPPAQDGSDPQSGDDAD